LVSVIPAKILHKEIKSWVSLAIFICYWVNNSTLGETTFWIVGSAVYLFTSLYVLIFLYYYLVIYDKKDIWLWGIGFILSFIAGCSVECLSSILIPGFCCMIYLLKSQDDNINQTGTIFCLIGLVFGATVLFVAPGNYQRLATFSEWVTMSLWEKFLLKKRYVRVFLVYAPLFQCAVISLLMMWYKGTLKNTVDKNRQTVKWMFLFVCMACGSLLSMGFVPIMPLRSWHPVTFFLIIAFSFFLYFDYEILREKIVLCFVMILTFGIPFIKSYACIMTSYNAIGLQQKLRVNSVQYHKNCGDTDFVIPNFYFPVLVSDGDKFSMNHWADRYGSYFGVNKIGV